MGNVERFANKIWIPRREYEALIVAADGEHRIGRAYNFGATKETTKEELEEIHAGRRVVVLSECVSERVRVTGGLRELLAAEVLSILMGDYATPDLVGYTTLSGRKLFGRPLFGTDEWGLHQPYGMPQVHDATYFPAPTGVTLTANGTGTIANGTYYGWAVPYFRNTDLVYGAAAADFTAANYANLVRGRDMVFGTPSASGTVVISTGPTGMRVTWTPPTITDPPSGASQPRPTGYCVVVGTVNSITDAGSKVCTFVDYGTNQADFSAIGATAFGASPAVTDLRLLQAGSVSAETRVWTTKTEVTDYTWDTVTGTVKRTAASTILSGQPVRALVWTCRACTAALNIGTGNLAENYRHLRLENWQVDGVDPDTRLARGIIVDVPRVNFAGLNTDLLTQGADGFHAPLRINLDADYSHELGYTARVTSVADANRNLVDYWSGDITEAAA